MTGWHNTLNASNCQMSHIFIPTTTTITSGESEKTLEWEEKLEKARWPWYSQILLNFVWPEKSHLKRQCKNHEHVTRPLKGQKIKKSFKSYLQWVTSYGHKHLTVRDCKTRLWVLSVAEGSGTSWSQSLQPQGFLATLKFKKPWPALHNAF